MQKKKGISLIVLVITIIVMIILAAAVVISINNSSVMDKADVAVKATNLKQVEQLAALKWAEAYTDDYRGTELVNKVMTDLADYTTDYDITVTDTGISVSSKPVLDTSIVAWDVPLGSYSTSSAYYEAEYEYPIGLIKKSDVKKVTFYAKVNGESDDKYVAKKVKFYNSSTELESITGFASSIESVLVLGLAPDSANIIKVVYEYNDGTKAYAVSEPTEIVCFVAGTKVYTENGLMNIEDVKEGMKVYSRNLETGANELQEILATSERTIRTATYKISVNGEVIESTDNHPYYVKDKDFVEAKDLKVGDVLVDANGIEQTITGVELVNNTDVITVYNMTVAGNHNYYVGNTMVLVHNASCPT